MIEITDKKEFHLSNQHVSYIFRVMEKTHILEHLYFGPRINSYDNYDFLIERDVRTGNNFIMGDHTSSFEHIKQEVPVYGTTDFRYPSIELEYSDGDRISHFEYFDYRLSKGKTREKGQPRSFASEQEAEVLTVILKNRYSDIFLELDYGLYKDLPIITRQQRLINKSRENISIEQFMSLNLDIPNENYEWVHLDGAWARERHVKRQEVQPGVQHISSTRGASSHVYNPFFALVSAQTTENKGNAIGIALIYSGNFLAQIERDNFEVLRLQIGINPYQFKWLLKPNEMFQTPEAVVCYSDSGLNGMSQTFHDFFNFHVINNKWQKDPRPVLINSWEATYFDFNEEKLLEIAQTAKRIGIDLFVLDDGWFGTRDSDEGSLGNWKIDYRKLPNGIKGLSEKIHSMGLKFGLWIEPEMISMDTPLYKKHPEWVIGHPQKNISHGRNQYVLNFAIPEVVENIYHQLESILNESKIDYIKWDMNRYISEAYSVLLPRQQQGELFHRYILGVYQLYEMLIDNFPDIMIESCAGGGGRFDAAMLYYAPQAWTSDNTDAIERLKIQYGTSFVYPLSTIGAHISEVPNHQVGRTTPLTTRSEVAMFGTFGFELDITKLNEDELLLLSNEISKYKLYQSLITQGKFYRLLSPFDSDITAWMVVAKDQSEALVGIYQPLDKPNDHYHRLKLPGLNPKLRYHYMIHGKNVIRFGDDLEKIGLILADNYTDRVGEFWSREKQGDFYSKLIYLKT
ncbi:alpha-galactosidase [Globicatella sulfidifaciens]|uniref:Alpha-galactosidase n=1 Tax=Globicatella sulfidifaciens DSM 15739 TaxID=1121925 RepID=A0A1T4MVP5_9LACT|nr:alpha-galactosidase [Globicatella sulfidifaciens]SJZ70718.1 alpha-galactosidase [Globicatella sulfidifaciens DSM 15739]